MPLLAYGVDGAVYHAWAMSPAAWEELKAGYRDRGLTAPCCGAAVVPVRSLTGWQFFRHKPNTGCAVRESLAHIVCKSIMARAAARLGLDVTTEARADDGAWVADVLVRHLDWTVALEAQLSRIPLPPSGIVRSATGKPVFAVPGWSGTTSPGLKPSATFLSSVWR